VLTGGLKEEAGFLAVERADLLLGSIAGTVVTPEPECGVSSNQPVLDGLGQDATYSTADVLDALAAQTLLPARGDQQAAL